MKEQQKSMQVICSFKDTAIKTFQNFEDYKESRRTLPDRINALETKTASCQQSCQHKSATAEGYFKKVDFLMTWYGRGAALIFSLNVLIAIMVFLGRYVDIKYVLRP